MDLNDLKHLLTAVQAGDLSIDEGLERLRKLPFEDAGIAMIDHHRALRQGVPEVVFGEGKTTEQICTIVQRMVAHGDNILITRISSENFWLFHPVHAGGFLYACMHNPVDRVFQSFLFSAEKFDDDLQVFFNIIWFIILFPINWSTSLWCAS